MSELLVGFDEFRWLNAGLNAGLAALALAVWTYRGLTLAEGMHGHGRRVVAWVAVLLAVSCYGSVEAAIQGAPPGWRVLLLTISLSGLLAALLMPHRPHQRGHHS